MSKKWYVIHAYSGHENKVKTALEKETDMSGLREYIGQIKVPTIEVSEHKGGKKKTVTRKSFPGYVLVEMEMNDQTWSLVKRIPSVTGFVGAMGSSRPKPLTDEEVSLMFDQSDEHKVKDKVAVVVDFSIGEHVKIIDGPFNNFTGLVEEINAEKGRLRVKVEIFGRGTPVDLDFAQVGKT
jgi:transcriptional antiterminator NusG